MTTHRGFIAISSELSFHADSAEQALAGIRRKVTAAGRPHRERLSALDIDIDAFVQRYRRYDVTVELDDARASGSCEYGIRSWCEAVGLDYEDGEAPLADILTAFQARRRSKCAKPFCMPSVGNERICARLHKSHSRGRSTRPAS